MQTFSRERLLLLIVSACTLAALASCLVAGALVRSGRMPAFFVPVRFGSRQALVLSNGSVCPPSVARLTCEMGAAERRFSLLWWTPERSYPIVSLLTD